MTTAARIAGICVAMATAGLGATAGQGETLHIVALGSSVKLPTGWKLIEDAGPRGCAFETPEGMRVEVVVWVPGPPAQGTLADERHVAWEHGVLLRRSCNFTSQRERQVPAPFGGQGLLVTGWARTGGRDWAGAFLAFVLDSRRACVIGSFAPAAAGIEAATEAIFVLVEALRAAQQASSRMLVARPEERPSPGPVTAAVSPGVAPVADTRPTHVAWVVPSVSGEMLTPVPASRSSRTKGAGEAASLSPSRPQVGEMLATGARLAPGQGEMTGRAGPLLAEWPMRPARVELATSPPTVVALARTEAVGAQATRAASGAVVAALPGRTISAPRIGASEATQTAALAHSRPRLAALSSSAPAMLRPRQATFPPPVPGVALGRGYLLRPLLAAVAVEVPARLSGKPAIRVALVPIQVAGLISSPLLPRPVALAQGRPLVPGRVVAASAPLQRGTPGKPSLRLAVSPVLRQAAWSPAGAATGKTSSPVAVKARLVAASVTRRLRAPSERTVASAVTLMAAVLAASDRSAATSPRRTSAAAAISRMPVTAFRLAAFSSPVARVSPAAAMAGASTARPKAEAAPVAAASSGGSKPVGGPVVALPASSGPTVGWVSDDQGLLRVKVPVGWKVSVSVTTGPALPALCVHGVHSKDPSLRFAWVQPSLPRYRDLSQLLVAMGYREWQAYKDAASGEVLVVAKRRGARRLLEDVVLPGSDGGLHTWQILDAQPSAAAAGLAGGGDGVVAHVTGLSEHGAVEGWYSVATGTPAGQSAQTWVGAWLAAVGPKGERRALEALVQAVAGASVVHSQASDELRSLVAAAQAAVRDLSRSAAPAQQ